MKHPTLFSSLAIIAAVFVAAATTCTTASAQIITTNLQLQLTSGSGVTTDDFGNVSSWADQSGNGNNALQGTAGSRPAYVTSGSATTPTGQASVAFNGSSDNLLGTMGSLTYSDIFIVGRLNSTTAANSGIMAITDGTQLDVNGSNSALVWSAGYNNGVPTGTDTRWAGTGSQSTTNVTLALDTWYVYEYRVTNAGGGNVTLTINYRGLNDASFVQLASGTFAANATINPTEYNLGSRLFSTPNFYANVDIASVLVYNGPLSTGNQTQVGNTLYNQCISVPEPQTWALAALGASAILFRLRRKQRTA